MKCKYLKASLKKLLAGTLGLMIFISSGSFAAAATSDQVTLATEKPGAGYVNTVSDSLRVRKLPSTSAQVVASLPSGSSIMIVGRSSSGFYRVQYDTYGNYGYVASQYIREYDLDYYATVEASSGLNMRSGRGTAFGVVAKIPTLKKIPILEQYGAWDYTVYGNKVGYVSTDYIDKQHY